MLLSDAATICDYRGGGGVKRRLERLSSALLQVVSTFMLHGVGDIT